MRGCGGGAGGLVGGDVRGVVELDHGWVVQFSAPPAKHASQLKQNAAYDTHYLALAESFGCELWTTDERFYRTASPSIDNVRWTGELVAPEQ